MCKSSYTLIELLFVIIVLGILSAIAIPRFSGDYIIKTRVKTAARTLLSDLRLVRRLSVTNNQNYRLSVDSAAKQYSIYDASDIQVGHTRDIYSNVIVSADKDFIFEPLGNLLLSSDTGISLSADTNQADVSLVVSTGSCSVEGP